MLEIAVWTFPNRWFVAERDHARRPERSEGDDDPEPQSLEDRESHQQRPTGRKTGWRGYREGNEPAAVERNEQRVVASPGFAAAPPQQRLGIATRMDEFSQSFDSDERDQSVWPTKRNHDGHSSSIWKAAVKPGPSDDRSTWPACLLRMSRSSTKSTVGADMLP